MNNSLVKRSMSSVKWNTFVNIFLIAFGFVESVVLARLLPVETFGSYAGANSIIVVFSAFALFGLKSAMLHRCSETADLDEAASAHFTIQLIIIIVWFFLMLVGGFLFISRSDPDFWLAYIVIGFSNAVYYLTNTPTGILIRRVEHRRLALAKILNKILTLVFAIILALQGYYIWALLVSNLVAAIVYIFVLYIWKPIWKPKLSWNISIIRYYLRFGVKQLIANLLNNALDETDDIWIKTYLGAGSLGFYSKAYSFALYPGKILANPVYQVIGGTYAEVSHDRAQLSEAFERVNGMLIRSGFLLVGGIVLIAPEFVSIVLGEKWLPMVMTFRLMLPFTLFDPMKNTMDNLFVAVGKPEINVRIRIAQFSVMVIGLFVFGRLWEIEGVALAIDLMMILGIILILSQAKKYVDFSLRKMFAIPMVALFIGLIVSLGIYQVFSMDSLILGALLKGGVFTFLYLAFLAVFDREEFQILIRIFRKHIFNQKMIKSKRKI